LTKRGREGVSFRKKKSKAGKLDEGTMKSGGNWEQKQGQTVVWVPRNKPRVGKRASQKG